MDSDLERLQTIDTSALPSQADIKTYPIHTIAAEQYAALSLSRGCIAQVSEKGGQRMLIDYLKRKRYVIEDEQLTDRSGRENAYQLPEDLKLRAG